ncbi:MAG TPA: helix-turn-helix transcriptional regulator [Acidobacteriaceae bacterium]|nr:helix-turn-helix transcriptional regulator [Acidobacteriaceae bacterium]
MDSAVLNRVRELRQARNWTQEYLADAAGVSRQSINAIERQRYIPSLPLALTLAQLFTVPVEQLFTLSLSREDEPSPPSLENPQ